MRPCKKNINEAIYKTLLERFGEPIGDAPSTVGVPDDEEQNIDEVTPPGEEKLVRKLKKQKGVDNPWALAWDIHNKR